MRPYRDTWPTVGQRCFIDPTAAVIGRVTLGDDVSIWPMVTIRGDVNDIHVGARTNIQDGSVLHVARETPDTPDGIPLIIGEDVTVGHKAMLHACTIGNRVLVGMGAIVLDGVIVEDEVLIAAGSLVPPGKRLASGYLYRGAPVQPARPLTPSERAHFQQSADQYVALKDDYLASESD